jgi:cytochrome c
VRRGTITRTAPTGLILSVAALLVAGSAQAQGVSGEQIFKQRCQMCHGVRAGAPSLLGPSLAGVVGRKAGTTAFAYTPAMKAAKITWTKDVLDKFLTAPGKMVPGTRMVMSVSDAVQRRALVGYLATLK